MRQLAGLIAFLITAPAFAQPQSQPLVQFGDLSHVRTFALPTSDGAFPDNLTYGGNAIGIGPAGSLYYGCIYGNSGLARVSIPASGTATVLDRCAGPSNITAINPGDPNGKLYGGSLFYNGRIILSAYSYYDGAHSATASHWAGASLSSMVGPVRVGTLNPGWVGGYMTTIPQEWRALMGGPALTGLCCTPIISRTSHGPSVSVFDPDQIGNGTVNATRILGYPEGTYQPALGNYGQPGPGFNGSTEIRAVAWPSGTRSVLFFGRHGSTYCYGTGTADASLAGKPVGDGSNWCYDPTKQWEKGTHGYPYKLFVWAYDANDLLAVKQGTRTPQSVVPYGMWTLPGSHDAATFASGAFDDATGLLYYSEQTRANPVIRVLKIARGSAPPPPPTPADCAGTWSTPLPGLWTPAVCDATGEQARVVTQTFTVTSQPANGGAACPASPRTTTEYQACTYAPPPDPIPPPVNVCATTPLVVTVSAWPGVAEGSRALRYTATVNGATVQMAELRHIWTAPQRLLVTDARGCSTTVTR